MPVCKGEQESTIVALRARVAKLEAALTVAGAAMVDWLDAGYKLPHLIERIDAINAVIEDAPQ